MKVYYDGHCQICIHFASFLRKVDFFNKLHLISFRSLNNFPTAMEHEIHVNIKNKTYTGYRAIVAISRQLPTLWILLPGLYLFQCLNVGDFLYQKFAQIRNRLLQKSCDTKCFRS